MKKIMIGFTCGILLTIATGAAAATSTKIQAILFPSVVKVHSYSEVKGIEKNNADILNYKNRVYVPLRTFSEAMGATVTYHDNQDVKNSLPSIDIVTNQEGIEISENKLAYSDKNNFVKLGYVKEISKQRQADGNIHTTFTGVIKINKDLTNKNVRITGLDAEGKRASNGPYISIYNQDDKPPKAGDFRSFRTEMISGGDIKSFEIEVVDFMETGNFPDIDINYGDPIGIIMPLLESEYIHQGQIIPINVLITNTGNKTLLLQEPFHVEFTVTKIDANGKETIVYQKPIINIEGPWKSKDSYHAHFYWDLIGEPLVRGKYKISLNTNKVSFSTEGSAIKKQFDDDEIPYNHCVYNVE